MIERQDEGSDVSADPAPEPETKQPLPEIFEALQREFVFQGFQGNSGIFNECLEMARAYAPFKDPILITGETGVGKRGMVKAMHSGSGRGRGPLVVADCSQIPIDIMASTFFGHTKGAFTGAIATQRGLIEEADGGTLSLDEVENLTPAVQEMLLTVLDSHNANMRARGLGSTKSRDYNVRLICSTNADLQNLMRQGKMREDFFHRIRGLVLNVPPLRDRGKEYIQGLIAHLLKEIYEERFRELGFSDGFAIDEETAKLLLAYPWPGNIRELNYTLKQAAIRAVVIRRDKVLRKEDFPPEVIPRQDEAEFPEGELLTLASHREKAEREYMERILIETRGKIVDCVGISGMNRNSVYEKIKKHGLDPNDFRHGRAPHEKANSNPLLPIREHLTAETRKHLEKVIRATHWNVEQAAHILGLTKGTAHQYFSRYGISSRPPPQSINLHERHSHPVRPPGGNGTDEESL